MSRVGFDDEQPRHAPPDPDELALEVLLPAIAATGRTSREPRTMAQLLEHREPSFGRELDIGRRAIRIKRFQLA